MLQLVAYLPHEVRRFPLNRHELTLGSAAECDINLPFPGVAALHAKLRRGNEDVQIESAVAEPVLINGRPLAKGRLVILDELRVGDVHLVLEDPAPGSGPKLAEIGSRAARPRASRQSMLAGLSELSSWVLSDVESNDSLEIILRDVLEELGGGAMFLFQEESGGPKSVRFTVVTDPQWLAHGEALLEALGDRVQPSRERSIGQVEIELDGTQSWVYYRSFNVVERRYTMLAVLPDFPPDPWSPALPLATMADLVVLGLIHHLGRYEPIMPGRGGPKGLTLAPNMVLGPAAASAKLQAQLRSMADSSYNLVLYGEPGSGRELAARTVHLSGPRRDGPFVAATCQSNDPRGLEADLFGAEVAGRGAPLRREGKILLASGGTLFLDEVDELPLELQTKLVRVLRTGLLEGPGEDEVEAVDLRLMVSSRAPLETLAAAGRFRGDLAHRMAQLSVEIPPLRERLEDLPMLIQSFVNRYAHATGKRVRGITVRALSTLTAYPFPGNLRELENVVRQMVFLAGEEKPMDVDLLPPALRHATLGGDPRGESPKDLELATLVAGVERAAIQEALRRTGGNKSEAARLLGLSRNGLGQKIVRYRL